MQIFYTSITSIHGGERKEIELTSARLADVTTVRRPDMNQLKFKYPLTQDKRFYMTADGEHLDTWAHSWSEHMIWWFMPDMTDAPINVTPAGGGRQGMGGDLTFFKNLQSNSLPSPTGKSFQSNATEISLPRAAHCCQIPQGRTQERHNNNISKLNSAIFLYKRCCITKDVFSCYSCNYTF